MITEFHELIFEYRRRENLTLEGLGSRTGYSPGYLGKIERKEIEKPATKVARTIADRLNLSMYSTLVSFNKYRSPLKLNIDVDEEGEPILEEEMLQALKARKYTISAYKVPFSDNLKFNNLLSLSVESGVSESRLEEIIDSYDSAPKISIKLEEVVQISKVLNKRFQELFAIVCPNIHDKATYHMACAIDEYVETKKSEVTRRYDIVEDQLSNDEIIYLQEMLKVYRKLKLNPSQFP